MALIVLCVALVLAAELLNSAVEAPADHLYCELHSVVGKVKEMLVAMLLVISVGAAVVAMIALYASVAAWSA